MTLAIELATQNGSCPFGGAFWGFALNRDCALRAPNRGLVGRSLRHNGAVTQAPFLFCARLLLRSIVVGAPWGTNNNPKIWILYKDFGDGGVGQRPQVFKKNPKDLGFFQDHSKENQIKIMKRKK